MPPLLRPLGSLRATQVQGAMQLRALVTGPASALRRPALGLPRAQRRHQRTQAFFGKLFGGAGTDQDVSGPAEEKQHPAAAADGAASAPPSSVPAWCRRLAALACVLAAIAVLLARTVRQRSSFCL